VGGTDAFCEINACSVRHEYILSPDTPKPTYLQQAKRLTEAKKTHPQLKEDVSVFSFVDRAGYTIHQELEEWSRVANSNVCRAIEEDSPRRDRIQANAGMIALIQEEALLQAESFRGMRDRAGNLQAGAIVTDLGEYLYVDFLASAPWNIIGDSLLSVRRAATILMAQIVRESIEKGYGGRVVVDAVGGTADFYRRMGFIETEAGSAITPEMALSPEAARDFLDELTGE
jgi:hypothetical protein